MGMFENTAVIWVHLGDRLTFDQLLTRVREAGLAFGRAVARGRGHRGGRARCGGRHEPGRNPLFDVTFTRHGVGESSGLAPQSAPGARLDLCCEDTEQADGSIEGRFGYATQLFDEATISRLASDYVRLLAEVADNPARLLR